MKKKEIPVVFSTDEKYYIPTYIAISSMLVNIEDRESLQIFILIPDKFSVRYRECFEKLEAVYEFCRIDFLSVGENYKSVDINNSRISIATLYRLLLPELLKDYKYCLYLDSDIVVRDDINGLLCVDLEDNYIAGVRDSVLFKDKELNAILGIPSMEKYINAGVLLVNLERLREDGVHKALKEMGYKKYPYNDQDILNIVCFSRIKVLSQRNNVMSMYIHRNDKEFLNYFGKRNIEIARNNPLIVHYVTFRKPWVYRHMPGAEYWWDIIDMLDEHMKDEFVMPYLKKNKSRIPVRDYVRMWIVYISMKIGFYPALRG